VDLHGGQVPSDMDALVGLPGVGRKTANVVRGHAFRLPGFPVDRHVLRVASRIGLISPKAAEDAVKAETKLMTLLPPERWTRASDTLILHGRRICKPKPLCERCAIRTACAYYRRK
jgi:endonuclease-3